MEHFLKMAADLLETDQELSPDMEYRSFENWDSLTVISFLAMVDVEYNKKLRVDDVKETRTFRELYDVIQKAAADK